jgi:diacylglycerol kinase (ATP)
MRSAISCCKFLQFNSLVCCNIEQKKGRIELSTPRTKLTTEVRPQQARSIVIAMNPHSGALDRRELVGALEKQLALCGFRVEILTDLELIRTRTCELLDSEELLAVVAAGGDGTISRLLNELPCETPWAIFPLGTENLMAKYLCHSADPIKFAEIITSGRMASLDLGQANGKRFLIMASCGFDADVVQRLHAQRKGHIRHWSYARPIFESIGNYSYPLIEIWVDDRPEPLQCRWAFIFNVPRYAMNLPIVTDADPTDGWLELCSFREGNLLRGLYYLAAVITGRHRYSSESHFCKFKKIRITAVEGQEVPFQIDGDPGGKLPLEIEILPSCFRVMVTAQWIEQNIRKASEPIR